MLSGEQRIPLVFVVIRSRDTIDLEMWKSLRKNPAAFLEELINSSAGARGFEVSGHKFWALSSAKRQSEK